MSKKVLIIGDWIDDVHLYGKVTRLCPEAPVPVWTPGTQEVRPGGMGLVTANLAALGLEVTQYVLSRSRKTRFWSDNHLILRQDEDTLERKALDRTIFTRFGDYDAVVISDYQKGAIGHDNAKIIAFYAEKLGVKLFVDTKSPQPWLYKHAYAIFPNATEWPLVAQHVNMFQHVIRKDGANGCYVDGRHVPAEPKVEAFDVTGAGDVFLAAYVAFNLESYCDEDCARFANLAAAISVKHRGGYVLTPEDVKSVQGEE